MELKPLISEFVSGFNSKTTKRAYMKDNMYFLEQTGISTVEQLTTAQIIAFRDFEKSRGSASASISRRLSSVRSFSKFLRAKGHLNSDVFVGVAPTKISRVRPTEALTDEEVRKIIKIVDKEGSLRDRVLIRFLAHLGLRREELTTLKRRHIYQVDGMWAVNVLGKGEKQREIGLQEKLAEMVVEMELKAGDHLFGISGTQINNIVHKFCKKAGITKRITPHSWRATVISHLLESNESPRNIAAMAGHSNINTTMGYDKKRDGIKNSAALKVKY